MAIPGLAIQRLQVHAGSPAPGVSARRVSFARVEHWGLPVFMLDEFRVTGHPFGPHPHAGFSAVTYLFEDSPSPLRSRDSLGHDRTVGPGGVAWLQAGRGALHEELPAVHGGSLHGLQVFVRLPGALQASAPRVFHAGAADLPVWRGAAGDRIRVLAGSHGTLDSPLKPDPSSFRWLDLLVSDGIEIDLPAQHRTVLYGVRGDLQLSIDEHRLHLGPGDALAVACIEARAALRVCGQGQIVVLGGPAHDEPLVCQGPFAMRDEDALHDAVARFQRGEMGSLLPAALAAAQ